MVMLVDRGEAACIKAPCGGGARQGESRHGVFSSASFNTTTETTRSEIALAHIEYLKDNCRRWLEFDFSAVYGEISYSEIEPGCILEEYIQPPAVGSPDDLKFYTAQGRPIMVLKFTDRVLLFLTSERHLANVWWFCVGQCYAFAFGAVL